MAQSTKQAYTHMYNEMENAIPIPQKNDIEKVSRITMQNMHTHTHTQTVQTDRSEGQCGLTEIF